MGYHGTGVNYGGRELDELREPVVYGLGPSGLSQSQQAWQDVADQLRQVGMYVESSMNKNAAAREGAAADAANTQGLSPLASYAQAAQIQAEFAAEATGNQADYYTSARNSMPDHMDRPSLWPDILTPWEYFRKKREYDRRVDRATDLMNSYQTNSNSNISSMPEFTQPQSTNIGMSIPAGSQVNPGSTSTTSPTLPAGVGTGPASAVSGAGAGGRGIAPTFPGTGIGSPGGVGGVGTGGGYGGIVGPGYVGVPSTGTGSGTVRPGTSTGTTRPGTGTGSGAPGTGTARPGTSTGTTRPGTGTGVPRPGTGTGSGAPGTGTARPGTGTGSGVARPGSGVARPGVGGPAGGIPGAGGPGGGRTGAGRPGMGGVGRLAPGHLGAGIADDGAVRGGRGFGAAGEHGPGGRGAGTGALRGTAGSSAFGPMGGNGGGDEDIEHRRPDYLVETEDVFRDGTMVAPPVIGEELPDYYHR